MGTGRGRTYERLEDLVGVLTKLLGHMHAREIALDVLVGMHTVSDARYLELAHGICLLYRCPHEPPRA